MQNLKNHSISRPLDFLDEYKNKQVIVVLKNKDVIITGITVGIIGYVIGNYLGVGLGYFLKGF